MNSSTRTEPTPNNKEIRQTHSASNGELLTVQDVAELLRVPISWVYHRARKPSLDRLPGIRLGKYWRFRHDDITEWLRRQKS
jgi:excisionase family DNA binding protein